MWLRIKDLFHDSFFYGASKFLGQVVSFFLIPLYTSFLTPEDYGVTTILGIYSIVLALIANLGLESSIYNFLGKKGNDIKALDTASLFVFILSTFLLILCISFNGALSGWLFHDLNNSHNVVYATLIAFSSSLTTIPLTVLRLSRRVKEASIFSLTNITFSILFTFLFLVFWGMGVKGVLFGNLAGNTISLLYLFTQIKMPSLKNWEYSSLKSLLRVAIFLFPNKLFALALPYYSQFILSQKLTVGALGLYAVAWKFCTPLSLLFNTFSQAWGPYKFTVLKEDKNPKVFFANFFTFFVGGASLLYLLTSIFGDDILRLLTPVEFHQASYFIQFLAIVPLSNAFYFMMTTGYEFSESQKMRPLITLCGLVTVIISTNSLIDLFNIPGAAFSIAIGWIVMASLSYYNASRVYPIDYEWRKIFSIIASLIILLWISANYQGGILADLMILIVFLFALKLFVFRNINVISSIHLFFQRKMKF
jgi:O-antigen/teichoic acid export membrane protein